MVGVEKIHDRLYCVDGSWYWEDEPITDAEANHLRVHYNDVVDSLKKPWQDRDRWYDTAGRINYGWERE